MSTWKNILTDPPTPGTGIRATDGKSVFVGQISESDIPNHTWFTGVDLSDGSEICLDPDELTEWMPTEALEREKTADEMFRELGYRQSESKLSRELGAVCYTDYQNLKTIIYANNSTWKMELAEGEIKPACLLDREILTLARLIEEMEADDAR